LRLRKNQPAAPPERRLSDRRCGGVTKVQKFPHTAVAIDQCNKLNAPLSATYVLRRAANTAYNSGDTVMSPNVDTVTSNQHSRPLPTMARQVEFGVQLPEGSESPLHPEGYGGRANAGLMHWNVHDRE